MTDYWLTKHYGGLVCDIQGWFRRGRPLRRNQSVAITARSRAVGGRLKAEVLAIFFQPGARSSRGDRDNTESLQPLRLDGGHGTGRMLRPTLVAADNLGRQQRSR